MRLATLRTAGGTVAARVEDGVAVELDASDVGALLGNADWMRRAGAAGGARHDLATADLAPVVPHPGKIICVGLNYRRHILEMGRELPEHPTLFAKFAEALTGPADPISLDPASQAVDWEAELAVVIGNRVRRADRSAARASIAGFSVINDVTMRDWQYRSAQWLQGKTFEGSTPFGPVLVTPDHLPGGTRPALELRCEVNGAVVQTANTADLLFDPVTLVRYISQILPLNPGDVIATGTPGGVGHARTPPAYLKDGAVMVTQISGLGELTNTARIPHQGAV
jgi:acylpyruvate hydrolase